MVLTAKRHGIPEFPKVTTIPKMHLAGHLHNVVKL